MTIIAGIKIYPTQPKTGQRAGKRALTQSQYTGFRTPIWCS